MNKGLLLTRKHGRGAGVGVCFSPEALVFRGHLIEVQSDSHFSGGPCPLIQSCSLTHLPPPKPSSGSLLIREEGRAPNTAGATPCSLPLKLSPAPQKVMLLCDPPTYSSKGTPRLSSTPFKKISFLRLHYKTYILEERKR